MHDCYCLNNDPFASLRLFCWVSVLQRNWFWMKIHFLQLMNFMSFDYHHIINVWCNLYSQNNLQFYGFRSTKIEKKISTIISSPDFLNTPFFYTSFLFYPECSTMPYKRSERLIDKIILYSEDHSKFRREDRLLWNLQYWNTGNRTSRWKDLSVCISEFGSMGIYHLGWRFV